MSSGELEQQNDGDGDGTSESVADPMEVDEHVYADARDSQCELDCYPYTFTPLLLFAPSSYFDKGYSNYNSVAQFFSPVLPHVDMTHNVLFDRKNMLYDELLEYVNKNEMLVTCCIDAHFTAFQVLPGGNKGLYYDPLKSSLYRVSGESYLRLLAFLLLKCNYGDSQHIQDNEEHYTGMSASHLRHLIYKLWRKINFVTSPTTLGGVQWAHTPMNLERWVLCNDRRNPQVMSTQQTSNTCYFQTYLFAILCKVGQPTLARNGASLDFSDAKGLEHATACISRFLLEFFVQTKETMLSTVMRPLTNSNFVVDFFRYKSAPYYETMTRYLTYLHQEDVPQYELQYRDVMQYYRDTKYLHTYGKFTLEGAMMSTLNTKLLQPVTGTDDAVSKLCRSDYYKFEASNFMFGWNSAIVHRLTSFCELNALRKNQLLRFYEVLQSAVQHCDSAIAKAKKATKYRDYYFMPAFEVGQQELVDIHHYTFLIDICSIMQQVDAALLDRVHAVNHILADHIFFSTQKRNNYDKFVTTEQFRNSKKIYRFFLDSFMSTDYLKNYIPLGFSDINPKEKEINSLTQTVFYTTELMRSQSYRQEYEFEKECINQMARSNLRKYLNKVDERQDMDQKYKVHLKIGTGYTFSKYNTLMHFLNVAECYWGNPDLGNIQVFGKDIRVLLQISCQKIFHEKHHKGGFYYYGPFEVATGSSYSSNTALDLAVASTLGTAVPGISLQKKNHTNQLVITDRVFEFNYLQKILQGMFSRAQGIQFKSDNEVLNLCLLSLMLDFRLYKEHVGLLKLRFLQDLQHMTDTRELQVKVANLIYEFDRKNSADYVTRRRVEELLFEVSYKFLVNKDFPVHSSQFKLICTLNSDPAYQSYILLVKIYISLCQINKSVELDYYKVHCNGEYRIITPNKFSKATSDYLDEVTNRYTFSEKDGIIIYDEHPIFDLRAHQPEINLYKVRFNSATSVQSMVKYIELSSVFRVLDDSKEQYIIFMADNVLLVQVSEDAGMTMLMNNIAVEVASIFFNEAISFIPCFKYADSEFGEDVVLFASRQIQYLVDQGGQFSTEYYGMRHELIECINSDECIVDLNDEHVFKSQKICDLITESKTVVYFPDYLLQVPDRQQLINLLDLALHLRNVSFFILVLSYLRRCSVALEFVEKERDVTKISGPWREAILYVLNRSSLNSHYDSIFQKQFFDLNQHKDLPLDDFIDILCDNFTKYQRHVDGKYQIVPTTKQKAFLSRIICAEECFHFSEVGSGKTKVILPLLCQAFISNNKEVHKHLARGGKRKNVLIILVPEHLVTDARAQVLRYCLNLNYREEYRVYDDIFALLHNNVTLGREGTGKTSSKAQMKQVFVTSFNQLKKVLTYDAICAKVRPFRENILVVADEVDDFLDRNKLVFNICSNKNNDFDRPTLDLFFEVSRASYYGTSCPDKVVESSPNPDYWRHLYHKFGAIHSEIQDTSRSINKSFGIFNEETLRHCTTNIVHDIEGYKSLIARPYESVNRAMPGSYYSDVERTIYLTYVILTEDIAKYDELFQGERKFISYEYWNSHLHHLDFDDLAYGHDKLSEIVNKHPDTKDGLTRFLYEIILRRMEIRDRARSVSSIDIIFNFDCIGFTGTPFLDNYPTFNYIRNERKDNIPDLIDRSFYAYTSDQLSESEFQERFARFQGQNNNTMVEYVSSDFISETTEEMAILESIFLREERMAPPAGDEMRVGFNTIVDLCGIFKRSSIHDVRDLLRKLFGPDRFHYIYHIDQADNSDRVLCMKSDNDVQYDEEFYKHLCNTYGVGLRERIFFFIDNRNVIGKDVPFQLVYNRHYGQPLFTKSIVVAHDVDDFSKIWQAMGRSRTMNETTFSIYKSGVPDTLLNTPQSGPSDMKKQALTLELYVQNCDRKMAGNISSIYLTLVALFNVAKSSFFYPDEIVNVFLEKMQKTITKSVAIHEKQLAHHVLGTPVPSQILRHILADKFRRSPNSIVAEEGITASMVDVLLRHVIQQKFEQRTLSGDIYDEFIQFLSGEQRSQMEISYTKQQQKQKQKQNSKSQDSDAMGVFDKKNQLPLSYKVDDYFLKTLTPKDDTAKILMNLPISVPILKISFKLGGSEQIINVYPTVQFLYSHHIDGRYISQEVQGIVNCYVGGNPSMFYANFSQQVEHARSQSRTVLESGRSTAAFSGDPVYDELDIKVEYNRVRQNPQYTIAAIKKGVYIIGMKEQFNVHDLQSYPLNDNIQYITDEMGFVLHDKTGSKRIDEFGPYFIEQYIIMETLSKHEVAQNVLEYYCNHREKLQRGLDSYNENQGKGFICWRFLVNESTKALEDDANVPTNNTSKRGRDDDNVEMD